MTPPPPPRLPLAAASERPRGKPGRPRKALPESAEPGDGGHTVGTASSRGRMNTGAEARAWATQAPAPRLLDLAGAASYLSVSVWTIRDLIAAGKLARVRLPLPGGAELRKVLLDREDLDRLVVAAKDALTP